MFDKPNQLVFYVNILLVVFGVLLVLCSDYVVIGLFLGAIVPLWAGAMTMTSVGKAAGEMVTEIRRQFREIPGLLEGTGKPDTARCVEISTNAALKEMIAPGLLAVCAPVAVGFFALSKLSIPIKSAAVMIKPTTPDTENLKICFIHFSSVIFSDCKKYDFWPI